MTDITLITLGLQGCLRQGRMKDEGTAAIELTSIMKRNSCGRSGPKLSSFAATKWARQAHGAESPVDYRRTPPTPGQHNDEVLGAFASVS